MIHVVRLEYLTPEGWTAEPLDLPSPAPQRIVDRYLARGKFVRLVETKTGRRWGPDRLPPTDALVEDRSAGPVVWRLPECAFCREIHYPPYDGSCLL